MKCFNDIRKVFIFLFLLISVSVSTENKAENPKEIQGAQNASEAIPKAHAKAVKTPVAQDQGVSSTPKSANDTLKILARLIEIPGKFPPNDLYNYVYIMKYRVIEVLRGSYTQKDILVGHYNPLIPRNRIKGAMAENAQGTISRFEVNDKHILVLIKPIERVWQDAVEDDYTDSDLVSYFALKADTVVTR